MEIKFMAGEMAKLHGISKQTLLYYDSIGLLKPKEKDKFNKYRYYTLDQFDELDVIICLKTLGLQLKEIKNYLKKTKAEIIRISTKKLSRPSSRILVLEFELE